MCPFKAYLQCDFYEIKNITSCQCEIEHQNKKNIGLLIFSCLLPEVKILKINICCKNGIAYLANNQTEIEIENTHYARYALYYVQTMHILPEDLKLKFLKGEL